MVSFTAWRPRLLLIHGPQGYRRFLVNLLIHRGPNFSEISA
jgi:hypothetical protein